MDAVTHDSKELVERARAACKRSLRLCLEAEVLRYRLAAEALQRDAENSLRGLAPRCSR